MDVAIKITGLKKEYDKLTALNGIDLIIKKGQFFGLLGPNGAGKTTLIGSITGLVTPSAGSINVLGFDAVKDYKQARRKIGLSQQEITTDPYFPIYKIIAYQAGYYGLNWNEATKETEKILKQFNLWEKRDATSRELSGGMKRKVEIAKALVHSPEILILDEPTAGIDVQTRKELWTFISDLNKKGLTIILTTHYIEEAQELCDEIAIIREGKIIAQKPKKELIDTFATKYLTAEYAKKPKQISGAEINGKTARITVKPEDDETEAIKKLIAAGSIISIDTQKQTLEEIFVKLTEVKNERI